MTNLILPFFFRVLGIIRCTKNQKTQTYNANENRPKVFYKIENILWKRSRDEKQKCEDAKITHNLWRHFTYVMYSCGSILREYVKKLQINDMLCYSHEPQKIAYTDKNVWSTSWWLWASLKKETIKSRQIWIWHEITEGLRNSKIPDKIHRIKLYNSSKATVVLHKCFNSCWRKKPTCVSGKCGELYPLSYVNLVLEERKCRVHKLE